MARVLIVDDVRDHGEAMAKLLERAGHEATYVPNGREAIGQVLNQIPDVVLLDLLMPEMDGPSFMEVVRSYLRIQSLPVVIFTAFGDSPLLERARAAGVSSVLLKGKASTDDVLKAIEEAIEAA